MKLKKLSLLASAIAIGFSIIPLTANAQVSSNAPQKISQASQTSPPDLKLSQQQIQEITKIRSDTRTQIQNVLTDQQRKKIQTDLQAGKNARQVFASIQFTQQQQTQLRNIMVKSQQDMENVLTPAQKKTLNDWRASQSNQTPKR